MNPEVGKNKNGIWMLILNVFNEDLFALAILCLMIDILEYVLNWLEHQGQTAVNY